MRIKQQDYSIYYELNRRAGISRHGDHLLYALLALSIVLLLSYMVIRRQLSPLGHIQQGVRRMTAGELDHRIATSGPDDLSTLSTSINTMAERLQDMLDAKRQLLLAISHELRSPVTRARIATEMLPESINRERICEDLNDMDHLITDIMESERLQQNHAVLNHQMLNLVELVNVVLDAYDNHIDRQLPAQPLMISADETRLRILLRNLIGNALQHGKPADGNSEAQIVVTLCAGDQYARIDVQDQGPGIAKEHQASVTDAFFRPDESRSSANGWFRIRADIEQTDR